MTEEEQIKKLEPDAQFAIQKLYIKNLSFEISNSPEVFKQEWKPMVDMQMTHKENKFDDNLFEVVLSVTLTVKIEEETIYLVEVNQAGIFLINNVPDELIERILVTACPNILFPFVRETVSDLVTRGGFPQLLLAPVNFDALYFQQQQQAAAEAKPEVAH